MDKIAHNFNGSMLSIGDFNFALRKFENFGRMPFACSSRPNDLRAYMETNGMVDIGFHGPKFT